MKLLLIGGYANVIISLLHVIGLFWAEEMFALTGVSKDMHDLAALHSSLPYLLTLLVAAIFMLFGLYAFSAVGRCKLPFTKPAIYGISGIYLLRGFGAIILDISNTFSVTKTVFSIIAILIGILYLFGGRKAFHRNETSA